MPKPLLVTHTIKSHGIQVARMHMHDWLVLALLMVLEFVLSEIVPPFHRFVRREMMVDLKYPLKHNTVPSWTLPIIAILVPFVFIFVYYIIRRNVYDFHHATLGLLFAVFVTAVITNAIKDAVGRPRPNFFWRCFPDGKDVGLHSLVYDPLTGGVICHGQDNLIKDGHKSFPSGHTSWSFAGLGFLSLYLSGKIQAFDQKGHVAKLCIVFVPLLIAVLVGISRVDDYRHHWHDVFAGGFLGMTVATFCYLQFFPAPYHSHGWAPYSYFQLTEDFRRNQLLEDLRRNEEQLDDSHIPLQLAEVGTA